MSCRTEAYLNALYGRCEPDAGSIVLVDHTARKPIGIYRLDDRHNLAEGIRQNAGCFIKVNLMDADKIAARQTAKVAEQGYGWTVGNTTEVVTIPSLHLDVDAAKTAAYPTREQALKALWQMPVPPTMTIDTDGESGGFHAYWLLASPVRIESEEQREEWKTKAIRWQTRLRETIKAVSGKSIDSTANIDRVLRPVGSIRKSGNEVKVRWYAPTFYTPEDFYIPPSDEEIEKGAKERARAIFDRVLGPVVSTGKAVSDYIDGCGITPEQLLAEAGYDQLRDPMEWRRPGASNPGRSLKIATRANRCGINSFSGGDPLFSCMKEDGTPGRFYSVDAMFVIIRFDGNWTAASRWCHSQIDDQIGQGVCLEGILSK